MTPSKEAIDSCYSKIFHAAWESWRTDITNGLEAAYAIDVAPLEARVRELEHNLEMRRLVSDDIGRERDKANQRIRELEAENQRLKVLVDSANEIVNELIQYDGTTELGPEAKAWKAQLEGKDDR